MEFLVLKYKHQYSSLNVLMQSSKQFNTHGIEVLTAMSDPTLKSAAFASTPASQIRARNLKNPLPIFMDVELK